MSIFWQNSNNLAKKCSTTPVRPVHSSPATPLDARGLINIQSFSGILRTCSTQMYLLEKICLDIQFVHTLQNIAHQFLLELHCHR